MTEKPLTESTNSSYTIATVTTANTSSTSNNNNNDNPASQSSFKSLLESDSKIKDLLNTDSALEVLLNRLKESLNTNDEFSKFIKKKAQIEDEHYNQLKKFAGSQRSQMKSNNRNLKNDSLQIQLDSVIKFDEDIYRVGSSYVTALNTMYDELSSLSTTIAKQRKLIKDEYRRKEKDCIESISAAEKAKIKYNHLCEDLERVKTSDPNKKSFSLKNKSLEQQEDDLQRKVDLADSDYEQKVDACKKLKDQILVIHRPNNTKKVKELILELDIALNVQLQKYATFCETLIMNSGVLICPLNSNKASMKSMANSVDNDKDLYEYILKNIKNNKTETNKSLVPIDYHKHPSTIKAKDIGKPFFNNNKQQQQQQPNNIKAALKPDLDKEELPKPPSVPIATAPNPKSDHPVSYSSLDPGSQPSTPQLNGPKPLNSQTVTQPTFGVSIEQVIQFAGIDNVPLVVRRCIEIIESFGINLVGIYRTSSSAAQVNKLKESIDDNFTNYLNIGRDINPQNVYDSDIVCVASLLKLYFSSLPEPLVTKDASSSFIDTVKSNDEHFIAKKLHHLVFSLPDGAYFTLRAIIFHLNKIASNESKNRMNQKSLAIIWGPVLFNDNSSSAQDLSYKTKVVEELMSIANDIFETDDQ